MKMHIVNCKIVASYDIVPIQYEIFVSSMKYVALIIHFNTVRWYTFFLQYTKIPHEQFRVTVGYWCP